MNLYLDDARNPPDDGREWTVVRSAEAAKLLLQRGPVEFATLDCDMGECEACDNSWPPRGYKVFMNTCRHKMNGLDLVKWMVEANVWPVQKPLVHSANEKLGAEMRVLIDAHWGR